MFFFFGVSRIVDSSDYQLKIKIEKLQVTYNFIRRVLNSPFPILTVSLLFVTYSFIL